MGKIRGLIKKLSGQLMASIKRFPFVIGIATTIVTILIIMNHWDLFSDKTAERLLLVLFMALPVSAVIKLFYERLSLSRMIYYISILAVVLGGALFYLLLPEDIGTIFYFKYGITMVIVYLIFTIVPYFYRRENYSLYCVKIVIGLLITIFYALAIFAGVSGVVFSLEQLFSLDFASEIYLDIYYICAGVFGVAYFLGNLPSVDADFLEYKYPVVLRVFFVAIVMPILTVYTVVLYAYFIKILVTWNWPEGLVGHLVLWYGVVSMITIFAVVTLEKSIQWVNLFKRVFPFVFIIPLGMMITTIVIRLNAYGMTIRRYYVLVGAIWFVMSIAYLIFNKRIKTTFIISSLILLLLISAYGPVNAVNTSIYSQDQRLKRLLEANDMVEDNMIVKRTDLDEAVQEEISSILDYMASIDSLGKLSLLSEDITLEDMEDVFGFEYQYSYGYAEDREYLSYYNREGDNWLVDIQDADYYCSFMLYSSDAESNTNGNVDTYLSLEEDLMRISLDSTVILEQSLSEIAGEIYSLNGNGAHNEQSSEDQMKMTYVTENDKVKVTIIFASIYGDVSKDNEISVGDMAGSMFIELR